MSRDRFYVLPDAFLRDYTRRAAARLSGLADDLF